MSDLTNLGTWRRARSLDREVDGEERRLWVQIAEEIDAYLGIHDADEPGLFDRRA